MSPGLLPFAVLSCAENREQALQQVAEQITTIENNVTQSNLAASAAILAGLVLDKSLVQQILRRELVQESVIYQEFELKG